MPRKLAPILAVLAIALGGLVLIRSLGSGNSTREIQAAIRAEIRSGVAARKQAGASRASWKELKEFYSKRGYRPLWTQASGPAGSANALLDVLRRAPEVGLSPTDYGVDELEARLEKVRGTPLLDEPEPKDLARLELALTTVFLRYGSDVLDGRVTPSTVRVGWHTKPRRADFVKVLRRAAEKGQVRQVLGELEPQHTGYRRLKKAFVRTYEVAAKGGWPVVAPGPPLRLGARGPRVAELRARLAAEGDLPSRSGVLLGAASRMGGAEAVFETSLEQAVRRFEDRYGLEPDGVVGPEDLAELNVPVESRLRQMELNLERWRWLPSSLGKRFILVNIPEFALRLYEGEQQKMTMRVVVGKTYNRTPVFSDRITYIVFNPTWNVPTSIAVHEIVPAAQQDPGYLARNRMRIFTGTGDDAREVDPNSIDWSSTGPENFSYVFRQDPGGENALGRIKFMLPNNFDIYLHDTPATHLFARTERDFSHGCIRVEKPLELAEYLLGPNRWDRARIEQDLASPETQSVTLKRPIAVHILYFTTWADEDGRVHFRNDVYGLDTVQNRAVRRHQLALRKAIADAGDPSTGQRAWRARG